MPSEDDIIQRIVLQGDKTVIAQFNAVGDAGQAAFNRAGAAADANSAKFARSGSAFGDIINGFRGTKVAAEDAAAGMETASAKGLTLATTLRLIGRATGIHEISRLGGAARALGKAFEIALPALLIAGIAKLGVAGAKSASDFDDLAAKLKITNPEMQALQAIGNASGLSFEELGKSLEAVDKLTKDTADSTAKSTTEYNKLKGELNDTAIKGEDLAIAFRKVAKDGEKSSKDFAKSIRDIGQASLDANNDFNTSLRKIEEQRNDIINGAPSAEVQRVRQLRDLNEQEGALREKQTRDLQKNLEDQIKAVQVFQDAQEQRRLELRKLNIELEANIAKETEVRRQMAEARIEAERNATALQKLGVVATDSTGKLKKAPEVLIDIARALGSLSDPTKQLAIEQDLINAGIDRKLIPALRRGEAGFKALQNASKNINPGFTAQQIKTADDFSIAIGQVGEAVSALFKQAGIAVAPAFISLFESLRDLFINIRPGVTEFAAALATVLTPALKLIVDVVNNFIAPAFGLIRKGLDAIAGLINRVFGTKLTGLDIFVAGLLLLGGAIRGGILFIQALIVALGFLATQLEKIDFSSFVKRVSQGADGVINVWNGVVKFFTDLWQSIIDAGSAVWTAISGAATNAVLTITTAWTTLVQFFVDTYTAIGKLAQAAWIFVSDQANIAVNFITGIFTSLGSTISAIWDGVKTKITDVWNAIKDFIKPITDVLGGGSGGGAAGFAGGGPIRGPGTGTSDSVPIWASAGEWMMRTAAVKKYGVGFMQAINSLRLDPNALGFALGGLVPFAAPQPRLAFAQGGQVPSRKNVLNLTIGDQSFNGLSASDKTMDQLTRFATSQQIRSAGRKPSWHGG